MRKLHETVATYPNFTRSRHDLLPGWDYRLTSIEQLAGFNRSQWLRLSKYAARRESSGAILVACIL